MSYTTAFEMLKKAQEHEFAVVGFAAYNLETVKELVRTANHLRAPVMIQTTPRTIDLFGIEYITTIVRLAAESVDTPVALHLDHGKSLEIAEKCLEYGYSSIMIDGSSLSYEDNVKLVREVVKRAHAKGVSVEAELGRIGGVEDEINVSEQDAGYTDPDAAADFVKQTGIDSLAVAIGTAHGLYQQVPKLNFELLGKIRKVVSIPLVLHGASGVPDDAIQEAIRLGIAKFNIASELKLALANGMRAYWVNNPNEIEPSRYMKPTLEPFIKVVEQKIILAGANNQYKGL